MSDKKIYCSIGPVPSGHKLGTMKECADKKQVRYWGVKKIDPKMLEASKKGSVKRESRDRIAVKMIGLRGKISKLTKQIKDEKDSAVKEKLKKDLVKARDELDVMAGKFKLLDQEKKKKNAEANERKTSRKNSKKGSK